MNSFQKACILYGMQALNVQMVILCNKQTIDLYNPHLNIAGLSPEGFHCLFCF